MNKLLLIVGLCLLGYTAQARRGLRVGTVERIHTVHELPDTEEWQVDGTDEYVDLATLYTDFVIVGIPVYVDTDPKLVLASPEGESYYEMDEQTKSDLLKDNNLKEADMLQVSGWSKWGGKLLIGGILAVILYGYFSRDDDEEVEPKRL